VSTEGPAPAYLVRGDDPALVAQAAQTLVDELVGERDPTLVVEEHGGPGADDLDVGPVVDAFTTPPFLVDRRVVVVRDAGRLRAADAERLVAALGDPPPNSVLVLVAGGGTVPQGLVKAVGKAGAVDASVGRGRATRRSWLVEHVHQGPVRLDAAATARLGEHLGEDLGRLAGMLDALAAAYGEGAAVGLAEVEPFLGQAGSVERWELTDAIDAGDTPKSLAVLHRLLGPGRLDGPRVLGTLHRHFSALLRLDGARVASPEEAAEFTGLSRYPAQKALAQAKRLGAARIGQAVTLLAEADLDVKGRSALPADVVLEVLVARLSRLVRARSGARR
jgi:DNA polymerase-3 subunit delta